MSSVGAKRLTGGRNVFGAKCPGASDNALGVTAAKSSKILVWKPLPIPIRK